LFHLFILFSRKYSGETFVQVYLKAPRAGQVKTRLAADIGDDAATEAYRWMVGEVLGNIPDSLDVCVAYSPKNAHDEISDWLAPDLAWRDRVEWIAQCDGDLGARLEASTDQLFRDGAGHVLVVGTDCPDVGKSHYAKAIQLLTTEFDVVFGPSKDGGYYLVGLNAPQPSIFRDIEWSSENTLADSLKAAKRAGLRIGMLEELEDIDDLPAWKRFQEREDLKKITYLKMSEESETPWPKSFRLDPIYMQRVWGGRMLETLYGRDLPDSDTPFGESWEVSDRDEAMSLVAGEGTTLRSLWNNHREEVFGQAGLDAEGDRFPLLVKILDCRADLSIQVHPPTEKAEELGGEPKTEMWYVAQADAGAKLYVGLKDGVDRTAFENAVEAGTTSDLVHVVEPSEGDFLFIPSGRLHAIGGGLLIFEIQQNSDTTYRVFDWNRAGLNGQPRELHVEQSLASINFDDHEPGLGKLDGECLVDCDYFKVDRWEMGPGSGRSCLQPGQFCILAVVDGGLYFGSERLSPGDFRVVPASAGLLARPMVASAEGATLLVTTLPSGT